MQPSRAARTAQATPPPVPPTTTRSNVLPSTSAGRASRASRTGSAFGPRRIQSFGRLRGEGRNGYGRSHSRCSARRRTRRPPLVRSGKPASRSPASSARAISIGTNCTASTTTKPSASRFETSTYPVRPFEAEHAQRPRHAPLEHVFTLVNGDRRRAIRTGDGDGYVGRAIRGGDVDQPHFVPPRLGNSWREPRRFPPLAAMVVVPVGTAHQRRLFRALDPVARLRGRVIVHDDSRRRGRGFGLPSRLAAEPVGGLRQHPEAERG